MSSPYAFRLVHAAIRVCSQQLIDGQPLPRRIEVDLGLRQTIGWFTVDLMLSLLPRVAIVSSAQTQLRRSWDRLQHVDLIGSAVVGAIRGTGLTMKDVDFVIDCGSDVLDGRSISNCGFLGAMGAHHKEESRVEEDGLWGAIYATTKLKAGPATIGLVVAYAKPSESNVDAYYSLLSDPFYQRPVGLNQEIASGLAACEYLAKYGLKEDDLVGPTVAVWSNALANPLVELKEAPDAAAVGAGDLVAAPLRSHQVSRSVDGAVAVVLAVEDVARRITSTPVWITGMGAATDSHMVTDRAPGRFEAAEVAAATAYRHAGLAGPRAIDVAEVSATSIAEELMVLEGLGLAAPGKATELYTPDASVSVNPSGGAIPADPIMATGLVRLTEAGRILASGASGAGTAVVHGAGGIGMQSHCAFILEA